MFKIAEASVLPLMFSATQLILDEVYCDADTSVTRKKLTFGSLIILYFLLFSLIRLLFFFQTICAAGKLNTWHSKIMSPLLDMVAFDGFKLIILGSDSPEN